MGRGLLTLNAAEELYLGNRDSIQRVVNAGRAVEILTSRLTEEITRPPMTRVVY